eukprot:gnl/MRDRNA2_/MRDRNA2_123868_c0_seq1.p1 gnl/MRDRNA2_/MRDRNA2_123868_c0~~gnl/MRDRNA2_/MRDRNA2_123868_c0_seq1.p1  ORF type:complete len:1033 (-),score=192.30 gnl/MRDRNA2_/MRDRNA2_123868_c0_seq1:45-3143(-)
MSSRRRIQVGYEEDEKPAPQKKSTGGYAKNQPTPVPLTPGTCIDEPKQCAAVKLRDIGILPAPLDNCAIASRKLEKGTQIMMPRDDAGSDSSTASLDATCLEGHRFAVRPIGAGEKLTSWGRPFGVATKQIPMGGVLANKTVIEMLTSRALDGIPATPNFEDFVEPYSFDATTFQPGPPTPSATQERTFLGFDRGARGVGTRNFIVLLGTSSWVAPLVREAERRCRRRNIAGSFQHVDGVVAVAHTEAHDPSRAHNTKMLVRCLAGLMVHPNIGAVAVVDSPRAPLGSDLRAVVAADSSRYPALELLPAEYIIAEGSFEAEVERLVSLAESKLPVADAAGPRTPQPASALGLAMQCGGSDAFSGISGNAVAACAAREIVGHKGTANLAETDELIGAEAYVMSNVRDEETAKGFVQLVDRFKAYAGRHGHSAEGNPSGGNKLRGLYNIALKSLGAAVKKAPDVRLDWVSEYGERLRKDQFDSGGYYFMDSPGNDLESIAGQVACGCNLIYFITGNGSITNFPFVPTIKIITTSGRWQLLCDDMDFNAGRYQDGESLQDLGKELFELSLEVASGRPSVGEKAGHWQVSFWRDWTIAEKSEPMSQEDQPQAPPTLTMPEGLALAHKEVHGGVDVGPSRRFKARRGRLGQTGAAAGDRIALVLPTSLCSSEVARSMADKLNNEKAAGEKIRVLALPHTEGCGCSSGAEQDGIFMRTMIGHLLHPSVAHALLLEHGCEKTHNAYFREAMGRYGVDIDELGLGWLSIQLDGGISKVTRMAAEFLQGQPAFADDVEELPLSCLRVGLMAADIVPAPVAEAFAELAAVLCSVGENPAGQTNREGCVVLPSNSSLLKSPCFMTLLLAPPSNDKTSAWPVPTLDFAESCIWGMPTEGGTGGNPQEARRPRRGLQVMRCPGKPSLPEVAAGMAASGVDLMICYSGPKYSRPPAHPFVPMLSVTYQEGDRSTEGFDVVLRDIPETTGSNSSTENFSSARVTQHVRQLLDAVQDVASGCSKNAQSRMAAGDIHFQLPRGDFGISL